MPNERFCKPDNFNRFIKNDKHNYQVETFEKLKTMNYQISEAFNKLMETMQENNSTKTENNKNKKD